MDATLWRMSATTTASTVDIKDSILDAIGATPLVRLSRLGAGLTPQIVAKVESLNPGGSIKDRVAVALIEAAERDGKLKPGGTIVEPTSGNTGTGLAIAARLKGYRVIAVMPDKMSKEKIDLLRAYGAEVVVAPTAVPPESPESYYRVAERLAAEIPGAFQPNQYRNLANPQAHYLSTAPELWEQSGGRITHLVVGVGTGGTITGTGPLPQGAQPEPAGHRRRPLRLDLLLARGQALPGRGRRRGLLAADLRPVDRRSLRDGLRSRRLPHHAPPGDGRGHPRRRLGRPRRPRRAGGRARDLRPRGDGRRHPPRRRALVPVEGLQRRLDDPARVPGARHRPDGGRRALRQAGGGRDPAARHRRDPPEGPRRRGAPARAPRLAAAGRQRARRRVDRRLDRRARSAQARRGRPRACSTPISSTSWSPPSPRCPPATPCARRSSCWSAIVRR